MSQTPVLMTFAPMIDSECSRRVLRYYEFAFEERDRLFGWVSLLTMLHGGYGRVPLLYGGGFAASGPRAIVDHLDTGQSQRLLPPEHPLRSEIEAKFALFNNDLAVDVAALAYFHLLPARKEMIASFGAPVTPLGRLALPVIYGGLRQLFALLLRLRPARIDDVALRIEQLLTHVDSQLRGGQRYLVGDRPTLADLGMMSAMAPLIIPPAYARRVPPWANLPDDFKTIVERTRARPSGMFVSALYAELAPA